MKKLLSLALGLGLVFTVAGVASANSPTFYGDTSPANGIMNSRHNLGAYGVHWRADNNDGNGGTTEVCIFCHTPHHGDGDAPLWNKGVNSTGYTAYGTTIGGSSIDGSDCGISLACLSCHDGVSTVDTLINAPGYGNGGTNNVTSTDFMWTFTEDGNTKADFMQSKRLNIGTNLTNDHPVCEPYVDTRASLRPTSTVISTVLMSSKEISTSNAATANSGTDTRNRWAVSGQITLGASIGDLLRGPGANIVECSSCHDPHFSNKSWDEVNSAWGGSGDSDGTFLRRVGGNSISGVCRTCHDK